MVLSRSSSSSQFEEFNGIVRQCGGVSIAKSMFSFNSYVGFYGNASPCMKDVEFLLRKFESSWFIFESSPFKKFISFSISFIFSPWFLSWWTWLCVLFRHIAVLLDPWVRVVGFLRFHWSSNFVLLSYIESWYVAWKCHCYQETCHFPQKACILFQFLLIYLPTKAD